MTAALRSILSLPRRLLINPILARELRVAGRRRSTYITRAGFALLFAFGVVFVLLTMTRSYGWAGDSVIYRAQELTRTVQFLTYALLWTGFALLTLLGPVLTAGAICDERRARTLDTLAATPISPIQIVVGKLAARMQEACTLALIAAPALLALRVFGGVPGQLILAFVSVSICTTYLGAALGIWFSSWHRGSAGATVYAFLMLGLLTIAPVVISTVGYQSNFFNLAALGVPEPWLPVIFTSVIVTCPPAILAYEMAGQPATVNLPGVLGWLADHPWVAASAWLVVLGSGVVLLAARSVRVQLSKSEEGGSVTPKANTERESRRIRSLRRSPVYWRESTAAVFPKKWHMFVVFGVLAAFLGWAYAEVGMTNGAMHQLVGFAGLALLTLLAAVSTTGSIASEREARTWDVLMTVPLSGRHILASKILAALKRLAVPFVLVMLHFVAAVLLGAFFLHDAFLMITIIVPTVILYVASGLFFSLLFKKIITAVACNIILLISLWIGVPFLGVLTMEVALQGYGTGYDVISTTIFVCHPVPMLGMLIQHSIESGFGSRFADYQLADHEVGIGYFALAAGAQATMHLAGAAVFFVLSLKTFKARGGRSS